VTPVLAKLGYKDGIDAAVVARPAGLAELLPLPTIELSMRPHDWLLVFLYERADISRALAAAMHYPAGGRLWCAYPKKSGGLASDIDRDHGWEPLFDAGFLPVTQVAIDADWSALRFRRREEIARLTRKTLPGSAGEG
jgi:hypothetical protein